jgi:acyl carrier protein
MRTLNKTDKIMDIETKILDLLVEETGKTVEEIKTSTTWQDLDMDSLLTMEIILKVEDIFDVTVDEKHVEFIKNYNDLAAYLKEKL